MYSNVTTFFGIGDGQDRIENRSNNVSPFVIQLDAGITIDMITLSLASNDLHININGTSDQITVANFFQDNNYIIDAIVFNDNEGTTWDTDTIKAKVPITTSGNDSLNGSPNNDTINALAGDDYIDGGGGNDTLYGGANNDTLIGGEGDDYLDGGAGDDYIWSDNYNNIDGNGNNIIYGGEGDDIIQGASGNDIIHGGSGDDIMWGYEGNNYFEGGTGNDLMGGSGNDTYHFDIGDGQDEISLSPYPGEQSEVIEFANNINPNMVTLARDDYSLIVQLNGSNDLIVIGNYFYYSMRLDNIHFTYDSSDWNFDYINQEMQAWSTSGNDTLNGSNYIDWIDGLAGNDIIYGNGGDDQSLTGNTGNDTIYGGEGNDKLVGGIENDYLDGGPGNDTYYFYKGDGQDTISNYDASSGRSDVLYFMSSDIYISEDLLARNGNDLIVYYGSGVSDQVKVLNFFNSDNYAIDYIYFEKGDVTWNRDYIKQHFLNGTSGNDTLTGFAGDDSISGVEGNDVLYGLGGNDTLNGGTGNDTLYGGTDNDVYIVDSTGDVVVETSTLATEIDTIQSSVTYTLGANVENLILQPGTSNLNGMGNTLANMLSGNSGANSLNGGSGSDTMSGGAGNDTYVVADAGDVIVENIGEGTDLVQTSITYSIANFANVENITLSGSSGYHLTGNTMDNYLTGNSGNNSLVGGAGNDTLDGGTGNDTLVGGAGDDVFLVNTTGDMITENADSGIDAVRSSVTYSISSYANVEHLTLTGTGSINATGNTLNNYLTGNSGKNSLVGGDGNDTLDGGAGNDTLVGGTGDDVYFVDSASDKITESSGAGTDMVLSTVTYSISSYTNVEHLTLTGTGSINATGNTLNNYLTGNSGKNSLVGGDGNDTLDGGAGNDTFVGGTGNDVYFVDSASDTITESSGAGTDTVMSTVTYSISSYINVEHLTLTGSGSINATGNTGNNYLTGYTGANSLVGGAGNDTLTGMAGNDTLQGDAGSDCYIVGSGDGQDILNNYHTDTTAVDTLAFQGIDKNNLWFSTSGNNLLITVAGTNDNVTVQNWSSGANYTLDTITAGGYVLPYAQVQQLVSAMAAFSVPAGAGNYIPQAVQDQLAPTLASTWQPGS